MPPTEYQGSFGRSILSFRRDQQVHSMEPTNQEQQQPIESFQRRVADKFHDLGSVSSDDLLSIGWIRKVLDVFISCQEDFKGILIDNSFVFNRPPMDRLVGEFFDRSVKALDVCNAVRDGIEQMRQWEKQLEIVLCALDNDRSLGEGQFRRAKKALIDLAIGMLDEKDSNANSNNSHSSHSSHSSLSQRNRSFGRANPNRDHVHIHRSLGHFRSLSWSVSRSWSASKQLQALANNLVAPKPNEISMTNGLSLTVFTMNYVLLFVMWALVAAIPCQDRGLGTHFSVTRQFIWAPPILSLHERILEESKKRDRRSACGLLKEIHEIEKCARHLNELTDSVQFPLVEEKERIVRERVEEMRLVYDAIKDGLDPMEKQVREVFHRIVRSRTEGLDSMGRATHE